MRLTVRVRGRLRPAAALLDLRAPAISGGSTVSGQVTVRNTGNVRLDFDRDNPGALRVLASGHVKAALPFRGPLYPGEERAFRLTWADPPPFGHFDWRAEVRAGPSAGRSRRGFGWSRGAKRPRWRSSQSRPAC